MCSTCKRWHLAAKAEPEQRTKEKAKVKDVASQESKALVPVLGVAQVELTTLASIASGFSSKPSTKGRPSPICYSCGKSEQLSIHCTTQPTNKAKPGDKPVEKRGTQCGTAVLERPSDSLMCNAHNCGAFQEVIMDLYEVDR